MNKEEAIEKIKAGTSLSEIDPEFRKDRDVVMLAIDANGNELKYADEELKKDIEIALASIDAVGSLEFISPELWDSATFVEKAVKIYGGCFAFASKRLLGDKAFVLDLAMKYDIPISALSEELCDNEQIFLEVLKSNSNETSDFNRASERLKSNAKFMLDAIAIDPEVICIANDSLLESEEFVKNCLEINPESAQYHPSLDYYKKIISGNIDFPFANFPHWKNYHSEMSLIQGSWDSNFFNELDFDLIIQAMDKGAEIDALTFLSYLLHNEIDSSDNETMEFLKRQGLLLEYLTELQNDFDAVLSAVKNNGLAYRFASPELRKNMQISKEAVLNNPAAKDYISREIQGTDEWKDFLGT